MSIGETFAAGKKVFHRAFDNFDDSNILILDNCLSIYGVCKQQTDDLLRQRGI